MKFFIFFSLILKSVYASSVPTLDQLSQSDVNAISKEFASNFTHTILAPASSLGKIWGLEFGLMAGATQTPEIDRVSKIYDSTSKISALPTAGFIGGVTIPFGISAELNMIPTVKTSSLSLRNMSYALKWELTSFAPLAPFNLALRVHGNNGELSYANVINNASTSNQDVLTTVAWKNKSTGYNIEISKKLLFIEPYVGYGKVNSITDIGLSGSTSVSIFSFSSASAYQASNSGNHFFAGLNLNLFILKIGGEYAQIMGNKKVMGKLSFYF
jgi:hypothetical protein